MRVALLAAVSGLAFAASAANAAVNIYISETGTGVFAQTLGSLDLTGLTFFRQATSADAVRGSYGYLGTGAPNGTENGYTGLTGPTAFGDTLMSYASSGAGDDFGFNLAYDSPVFYVPVGYTSGAAISSSATFAGQTLASLELTTGTYVFASSHDTVTLHVGAAAPVMAVPEPAGWALMLMGFGLIGGAVRARRRSAVSFG